MTALLVACMGFGSWLYVRLIMDLAEVQRSGLIERSREGDRKRVVRLFWVKSAGAAVALLMVGFSFVIAFS